MREGEGAALVQLLAIELARFRRFQRDGQRHLARTIFETNLCSSVVDPGLERPCSERCRQVAKVLSFAAAWLGVEVETFYPVPKTRRRR